MRRQQPRRGIARGGISSTLDLGAVLLFWIAVFFVLVDLVQVGRGWAVAQEAAYDAAQGVAAYGCWTSTVTQVVQQDVAGLTLAPGRDVTVALTTPQGAPITQQVLFVSSGGGGLTSGYDPAMVVTVDVPIQIGGWMGIPVLSITMQGRAEVTSDAYYNAQANLPAGSASCTTPQG